MKVRVLNGTGTAGAAGDAAAALGQASFSPAGSGDADKFSYAKTEIRYNPAAQAKAALLARYLGGVGRLVADPSVRGTDVVLVVGNDWKGVTPPPGASGQGNSGSGGPGQLAAAAPPAPTTTAPTANPANGGAAAGAPAPAGGPSQPAC